jgi:hypothetical protein
MFLKMFRSASVRRRQCSDGARWTAVAARRGLRRQHLAKARHEQADD